MGGNISKALGMFTPLTKRNELTDDWVVWAPYDSRQDFWQQGDATVDVGS